MWKHNYVLKQVYIGLEEEGKPALPDQAWDLTRSHRNKSVWIWTKLGWVGLDLNWGFRYQGCVSYCLTRPNPSNCTQGRISIRLIKNINQLILDGHGFRLHFLLFFLKDKRKFINYKKNSNNSNPFNIVLSNISVKFNRKIIRL